MMITTTMIGVKIIMINNKTKKKMCYRRFWFLCLKTDHKITGPVTSPRLLHKEYTIFILFVLTEDCQINFLITTYLVLYLRISYWF